MSKSLNEEQIRILIEKEIEKKISKFRDQQTITREEFLRAIEVIENRFQAIDCLKEML